MAAVVVVAAASVAGSTHCRAPYYGARQACDEEATIMLNRWSDGVSTFGHESISDRRAAVLRADEERAAERHSQIEAQSSILRTPQERIELWERLHGLRLPIAGTHKLVRLIAVTTALTVDQVHEEQRRRSGASAAPTADVRL